MIEHHQSKLKALKSDQKALQVNEVAPKGDREALKVNWGGGKRSRARRSKATQRLERLTERDYKEMKRR